MTDEARRQAADELLAEVTRIADDYGVKAVRLAGATDPSDRAAFAICDAIATRLRALVAGLPSGDPEDVLDDEPVHGHFGLSYANYLVLHRTLMQSMPVDWQHRMVACLAELDDAFDHLELPASFIVEAAQEFEYGDLSPEQMKALGIEPEEDADGLPRFYYDRHGKEHERSDRVLVPLPGGDPIPLYDRGRARIAPNLAVKDQP